MYVLGKNIRNKIGSEKDIDSHTQVCTRPNLYFASCLPQRRREKCEMWCVTGWNTINFMKMCEESVCAQILKVKWVSVVLSLSSAQVCKRKVRFCDYSHAIVVVMCIFIFSAAASAGRVWWWYEYKLTKKGTHRRITSHITILRCWLSDSARPAWETRDFFFQNGDAVVCWVGWIEARKRSNNQPNKKLLWTRFVFHRVLSQFIHTLLNGLWMSRQTGAKPCLDGVLKKKDLL